MSQKSRLLLVCWISVVGCGTSVEEREQSGETGDASDDALESSSEGTGSDKSQADSASVLFVVSDAFSTVRAVEFAEAVQDFADALDGIAFRVAFTKMSASHPLCSGTDAGPGALVIEPCYERPEDFSNAVVTDTSCMQVCDAAFEVSGGEPWFEMGADGVSNVTGSAFSDALGCASLQGINGCGAQPLRVLLAAIEHLQERDGGFFRAGSVPVVVVVGDSYDCSVNEAFSSVFTGDEGMALWSGNEPSTAICWNASTRCDDGACVAVDRLPDGSETEGGGVLLSVGEVANGLRTLEFTSGHEPIFFPIAGAPHPSLAAGEDASEAYFERFGVDPVCGPEEDPVMPAVRMNALAGMFSGGLETPSICDGQRDDLMRLASTIRERVRP